MSEKVSISSRTGAGHASTGSRCRTSWSNVAVKLTIGDHVRRIPASRLVIDDADAAAELKQPCILKLRELAKAFYMEQNAEEAEFCFSYLDEEGERIELSTNIELAEALEYSCLADEIFKSIQFLRVTAHIKPTQDEENRKPEAKPPTSYVTTDTNQAEEISGSKLEQIQDSSDSPDLKANYETSVEHLEGAEAAEASDNIPSSSRGSAVANLLSKAEEVFHTIRKEVEEVTPDRIRPPPCIRKLQRKFSPKPTVSDTFSPPDEKFDPRFVHPRHQCDMCHVLPIRGFRWRAVRPKTMAECKNVSRKEFVEMNFDLCHLCYVGWREQQSDERNTRLIRGIQLPVGVKFHPVQLAEQDRREHLLRHQRQQQRQQVHPHVHLDMFFRTVATNSSRLAERCIKTLHLDGRREEPHVNLINCAEVNEGILKSLSQLSKKREDAKMAIATAVGNYEEETLEATAISSLGTASVCDVIPQAHCKLVQVPVENVNATTTADDPSVMTGDTGHNDLELTEILPSVTSEDVEEPEVSGSADLALSGVSGMTLGSSLTLKSSPPQSNEPDSTSSLYLSAMEGTPSHSLYSQHVDRIPEANGYTSFACLSSNTEIKEIAVSATEPEISATEAQPEPEMEEEHQSVAEILAHSNSFDDSADVQEAECTLLEETVQATFEEQTQHITVQVDQVASDNDSLDLEVGIEDTLSENSTEEWNTMEAENFTDNETGIVEDESESEEEYVLEESEPDEVYVLEESESETEFVLDDCASSNDGWDVLDDDEGVDGNITYIQDNSQKW